MQQRIEMDIQKYKNHYKNEDKSINNQESLLNNDISNAYDEFDVEKYNPITVNELITLEEFNKIEGKLVAA